MRVMMPMVMLLPVSDIMPMIGIMISSIIIFSRRRRRGRGMVAAADEAGPRQTAPGSLESSLYIKLAFSGLIFYTYHSLQLWRVPHWE